MNKKWYVFVLMLLIQQDTVCLNFSLSWFKIPSFSEFWDSIAFISKKDLRNGKDDLLNNHKIHLDCLKLSIYIKQSEKDNETNERINNLKFNQRKFGLLFYRLRDQINDSWLDSKKYYNEISRELLSQRYQIEVIQNEAKKNHSESVGLACSLKILTKKNANILTRIKDLDTRFATTYKYLDAQLKELQNNQIILDQNQKDLDEHLKNISTKEMLLASTYDNLNQKVSTLAELLSDCMLLNVMNQEKMQKMTIDLTDLQTKMHPMKVSAKSNHKDVQQKSQPKIIERVKKIT